MSLAEYRSNRTIKLVVERLFQIVTEAARRLGQAAELYCPEIPWRDIRDLGNVIRHAYDDINDEILWNAAVNRLPELKAAVSRALAQTNLPETKP
jgi:uncharacterized protein with HEPN domain